METETKIDRARVRKRRNELRLSQEEVVDRIRKAGFGKLTYQAFQQFENGHTGKPRYAMYLAEALETSWEYLTGKTENPASPDRGMVKDLERFGVFNDPNRSQNGTGQEGTHVLMEISRMLGAVEGSLKTAFNARFDVVDQKLDNHERRLEALESRQSSDPQRGRRR